LLKAVLGKACSPVTKSVLIDAGKKGCNGTEVVSLKDLRLGTFSETNSQDALNESMLKMISGGDEIKARGLYKDEIGFKLFLKLIVCTNHKPEFNGSDHGTVRRIKFLPFDARFSATPSGINQYPIIDDLEKILIKNHLNEFFTFCLHGANAWYNDKLFQNIPEAIARQQNDYIKEQNTVETWFTERVDESPLKRLSRPDGYKDYSKWCEENASTSLSKKDFFTKLTEKCGKTYTSGGVVCYKGFELRNVSFDTDDESL
jgi:putative DNA primase/helicase